MIDLITGRQGVAHISAIQVATLNNKLTGDIGEHKVVRILDGEITAGVLALEIGTGYWRVNGYDMEITEAENILFDPTTSGVKRIDGVYVEILQDIASGVQRSEIVVVQGVPAVSPVAPSAPTSPQYTTDLLTQCELIGEALIDENSMSITDATIPYKMQSGGAESLAPEFVETETYTAGDIVEHEGKLYQFTDDHTGAWDDADVTEVTISELLDTKPNKPVAISEGGTGATSASQALTNLDAASATDLSTVKDMVSGYRDVYSSTKAYKAGEYVIVTPPNETVDTLYRCDSACTAGSWAVNQSHFSKVTLTEAVTALNNDLVKVFSYSTSITTSASDITVINLGNVSNVPPVNKRLAVIPVANSGGSWASIVGFRVDGNYVYIETNSTSSITVNVTVYILYIS